MSKYAPFAPLLSAPTEQPAPQSASEPVDELDNDEDGRIDDNDSLEEPDDAYIDRIISEINKGECHTSAAVRRLLSEPDATDDSSGTDSICYSDPVPLEVPITSSDTMSHRHDDDTTFPDPSLSHQAMDEPGATSQNSRQSTEAHKVVDKPKCFGSCYETSFWIAVLKALRDPIVVGIVVALISSPRIQRRISALIPIVVSGDDIYSTCLRALAGITIFILIRRLI